MLLRLPDHIYRICLAFAVKKTYFLIFFKPVIDVLSIVMLNWLDNAFCFQPPPTINPKIADMKKCAQKMISKFFVLKLYMSWGAKTPKILQVLLQTGWRLYKSTVDNRK